MDNRNFDVVVLGATGFTGRLVADHLAARHPGPGSNLRWAIAGRNADKLAGVQGALAAATGAGTGPEVLLVDTTEPEQVRELVRQTRVLCTTVGPYALYGSHVVAACAEAGTHYCDLTGEVPWMRRMIAAHHDTARRSGARIVHTCGFDSIPSDLGVWFTQQAMHRETGAWCPQIKFRLKSASGGFSGGTAASLLNMVEEASRDASVRQALLDPYALNPDDVAPGPDRRDLATIAWDADFRAWQAPFVMAGINTRVVRRSHALLGEPWGRAFSYDESILTGGGPLGFAAASAVSTGMGGMMAAAALPFTRPLLARVLPAPGEGPDEKRREQGYFDIRLFGRHPSDPGRSIWVRVTGDRDPGYGATSKMLAESALCLAEDPLSSAGGLLTPSVAMGDALVQRLIAHAGMTFEVLGFGRRPPEAAAA